MSSFYVVLSHAHQFHVAHNAILGNHDSEALRFSATFAFISASEFPQQLFERSQSFASNNLQISGKVAVSGL